LPFVTVLPYIVIMLVEAGTAILINNAGKANGYYYFCIAYSLTYVVVLAAIIVLHVKENWSKLDIPVVKYVGKPMAYAVIMAVYVMFAFTLRSEIVFKTIIPDVGPYRSYIASATSQLPAGVLPYTIIVVGTTIWICLIGILVRLTLGTSARRPRNLFHPSQRSIFEEPSS